ncbi:GGDEF domain-containing protein [Thalassotalea sp. LPB0316]|uniref:GGDEF domain-containing protein n=1 Tax=Thalassotalea sp. LPB0316 TaxID=2769490 RepID=UPI0018691198|nr:GGDEF domain-containing protein [Thalassotalea sp. LPB0316]QOL26824.1 GGDEF domain-containing protein [Thalassotalea sp. LPB0316]
MNTASAQEFEDFAAFESTVKELEKTAPQRIPELLEGQKPLLNTYSLVNQIQYYLLASEFYNNRGNFELAKTNANQGLELVKQQNSPSALISELLYSRGFAYENLGDSEAAMQDYQNGTQLAESLEHLENTAYGYINIGAMQYLAQQFQASLQTLNKARELAEQSDDEQLKGYVYSELGILYNYLGDNESSLDLYDMSYNSYMNAGHKIFAARARLNTGSALMEMGRYEEAIVLFKGILTTFEKEISPRLAYYVNTRLASCYSEKDEPNYELAYQYLITAGKYIQGTDAHDVPVFYLLERAELLHQLARHDEVDDVLKEAMVHIPSMTKHNQLYSKSHLYSIQARSYYQRENYKAALASQKLRHQLRYERHKLEQQDEVTELKMQFESEQADVAAKILEEQKAINNLALEKAKASSQFQWQLSLAVTLIALLFAWGFIKLVQKQRVLKAVSQTDPLTGVANRYRLLTIGQRLIDEAMPYSLLMLDIDDFKQVNDSQGHSIGDKVIKKIAELVANAMRESDTVVRLGGEEFMVILPNTTLAQADETAERLRLLVMHYPWQEKLGIEAVTISLGVANSQHQQVSEIESLSRIADEKLYQAKASGRNRVCS